MSKKEQEAYERGFKDGFKAAKELSPPVLPVQPYTTPAPWTTPFYIGDDPSAPQWTSGDNTVEGFEYET